MKRYTALIFVLIIICDVLADDGSRLWLRYDVQPEPVRIMTGNISGPTVDIAVDELRHFWRGGDITLQTDGTMPQGDGFRIAADSGNGALSLTAHSDLGLLYGAYELLRRQEMKEDICGTHIYNNYPFFELRMLNHWDNPDGSIERGYAGQSIWKWDEIDGGKGVMSEAVAEKLTAYARANASVGINGTVLNNVNAAPEILTDVYLRKIKVIAGVLRPYGIRVFLSVNFASPKVVGGIETADPLNKKVVKWWRNKAKEIYRLIPDFGGFLVKANSEGQPGPGDYGRTHADGANMLARALKPYNGTLIWRSFVYGANHKGEDRVKQAVSEFEPCDGKFESNVILQSKNGPLDFQPREPYAPIFDRIRHTPQIAELQITQEYTGQSKHLVYLAPMWREFFGMVTDHTPLKGIAGVANIGDDRNWCGHHFSQANWYAFGRLAWNPHLSSESIADEWLKQTFTTDTVFVNTMAEVMETSREACVDYMMPLGLHHIFKADHHYGPEPEGNQAHFPIEWRPVYYHKADTSGIGFNRSSTGTNAVAQYREPYASIYDKVETCPENLLLWFHHVPWNHRMKSGATLWEELRMHYNHGVEEVGRYVGTWNSMQPYVDRQRHEEVAERLQIQLDNAREWRDTCIKYFEKQKEGK